MGEELGTTVNQNMGEELGNYVHQNIPVHTYPPGRVLGYTQTDSNITVHTDPPGRVLGHRQTVYMGEELGNYVHQKSGQAEHSS